MLVDGKTKVIKSLPLWPIQVETSIPQSNNTQ